MDLDSPESGLRESTMTSVGEASSRSNGPASSSRDPALAATNSANHSEFVLGHNVSSFRSMPPQQDLQLLPSNYLEETGGNEIAKFIKDKRDAASGTMPRPGAQPERLTIRESIISLLLRLYSTFGGQLDSYDVPEMLFDEGNLNKAFPSSSSEDGRIGDGRFWIKKILDKLCHLHPNVPHTVKSTVQALNEARSTKAICFSGTEDLSELEKKRRIKERQQRLLQEFANKQREFMQHAMAAEQMETDFESVAADSKTPSPQQESGQLSYTSTPEAPKELQRAAIASTYDCVICNQTSPSTIDRPMCLVILVQSTNMLKKSSSPATDALRLPINADQMSEFQRHQRISAKEERQRLDSLEKFSNAQSFAESKEAGRIYVQTCGHCLHVDCQKQYLQALRTQQRHQTMDVEHGEYACPLCRQLANSALPIINGLSFGTVFPMSSERDTTEGASGIMEVLSRHSTAVSPIESPVSKAIGEVIEDMVNLSTMYRRLNDSSSSPRSLSIFLRTTVRANIEIELMQRDESMSLGPFHESAPDQRSEMNSSENSSLHFDESTQGFSNDAYQAKSATSKFPTKGSSAYSWPLLPKRSCLSSLLHVLATQRKGLTVKPLSDVWKKLSGQGLMHSGRTHFEKVREEDESEAPLLTLDPTSLLVELTLCLPVPIQARQFRCAAQHLFNLLITQVITLRCQAMSSEKKKFYKENCICDWPLSALVSWVIRKLDASSLEVDEVRNSDVFSAKKSSCKDDFESCLHERAITFLRVAVVLQHYFLGSELPTVSGNSNKRNEFEVLCSCLSLNWKPTLDGEKDFTILVENWFNELRFASGTSKEVCDVIALYQRHFFTPRLLVLPRAYDAIFQVYFV